MLLWLRGLLRADADCLSRVRHEHDRLIFGARAEGLEADDDCRRWGQGNSRARRSRNFQGHLSRDTSRRSLCVALLPEEDAADEPTGSGIGEEAI
jgi:hypothetical protein